ncbi:MAG: phage tail tape measure protein [Pseudomonadota bacterium]
MAFASLTIDLQARLARFESDLGKVAQISKRNADQMDRAFAKVGNTLRALGGLLAVGAFAKFVKGAIDSVDELGKMSQRVGVSVESLSALGYAAGLSGVSLESLGTGLKKLSVNMADTQANTGDARDAFKALGLQVEASRGNLKSSEQVLFEIADRFANMEDGAGKTALAVKLFGRAGADMIPLLNQGANGLRESAEEARRFGLVISTDATKRAEEFNYNLTRLAGSARGLGLEIAERVLPSLTRMSTRMAEAVRDGEGFLGLLGAMLELSPMRSDLAKANREMVELTDELLSTESERSRKSKTASKDELAALDEHISLLRQRVDTVTRLRRFLSGETNVFGEPVRPPAAGKKEKAPGLPDEKAIAEAKRLAEQLSKQRTFIAQQWVEDMEEQAKIMSEAAQLTDDYNRREREGDKANHDARMKAWFEFIDTQREGEEIAMRLAAGFDAAGNRIEPVLTEMGEFAKKAARNIQANLSDTLFDFMQGKFENMGDRFKAMLDRMAADILAAQLGKLLFGDFDKNNKIGGLVGSIFGDGSDSLPTWIGRLGNLISGTQAPAPVFDAIPLYASGTPFVPRDTLAFVHRGERITPAAENRPGDWGGVNVTNMITVYANDADSFRSSRGQVLSSIGAATARAARRYS